MEAMVRIPKHLPVVLVSDAVLLPGTTMRIQVTADRNVNTVRTHLMSRLPLREALLAVVPVRPGMATEDVGEDEIKASIVTAAIVVNLTSTNWPSQRYTLLVNGISRIRIQDFVEEFPCRLAKVSAVQDMECDDAMSFQHTELVAKFKAKTIDLLNLMKEINLGATLERRMQKILSTKTDDELADVVSALVRASFAERKRVLESETVEERFKAAMPLLERQLAAIEKVAAATKKRDSGKGVLMPSLKKWGILGKSKGDALDEDEEDMDTLEARLQAAQLPPKAMKIARKELKRLQKMPSQSPEYPGLRHYLELVADLPWSKASENVEIDMKRARLELEKDHYAMEKVKQRILEYLAVRRLKNSLNGPILCFVGPPGVGKTSIARSIAATLGRKFHRISLGGVSDQSEIRGHRRTYIGSMAGKIIQGLKTVAENNPVFLLDEVDKMSPGIHGDPSSALLEVLDPEQNFNFVDHYLNMPFDLSQVLFIATANSLSAIPGPLRDRMEVISIPGYVPEEKTAIAVRHLLPKQCTAHGLGESALEVTDAAVLDMVRRYTREAGVRGLERCLGAVCRAVAVRAAEEGDGGHIRVVVDEKDVEAYLGSPRYVNTLHSRVGRPGVALGLAWTSVGGEVMVVEANKMATASGKSGTLTLTGQLGDVMKESATIALNWIRAKWSELCAGGASGVLESHDLHLHFPSGSVGKDGPSAGVAIAAALVSLLADVPTRPDVALTGEVTLLGVVLPVGGIKEKVLAAHREGLREVILPEDNKTSVDDIPKTIKDKMKLHFVTSVEEALEIAFDGSGGLSRIPFLLDEDRLRSTLGSSKL